MMELVRKIEASQALDALNEAGRLLANCRGGGSSTQIRDRFVLAMEEIEPKLDAVLAETGWREQLISERYWAIRQITNSTYRASPLVGAEVERLLSFLDWMIADAEGLAALEAGADPLATRAVPDTNIFLHFKQPNEIDWSGELKAKTVRIIVPITVVRELDNKKNAGGKTAKRATRRLAWMRSLLKGQGRGPAAIRLNTTIEVYVDPRGHVRHPNNDEEILLRTEAIDDRPGADVTLVTGDQSMQLSAAARGLLVLELDDKFRLPSLDSEGT
jgi:rRNA-processing protein FCF1